MFVVFLIRDFGDDFDVFVVWLAHASADITCQSQSLFDRMALAVSVSIVFCSVLKVV